MNEGESEVEGKHGTGDILDAQRNHLARVGYNLATWRRFKVVNGEKVAVGAPGIRGEVWVAKPTKLPVYTHFLLQFEDGAEKNISLVPLTPALHSRYYAIQVPGN